jgi:hypothetical protein
VGGIWFFGPALETQGDGRPTLGSGGCHTHNRPEKIRDCQIDLLKNKFAAYLGTNSTYMVGSVHTTRYVVPDLCYSRLSLKLIQFQS